MLSRLVPVLIALLAAGSAAKASPTAPKGVASLVLFSGPGFQGRQLFYDGREAQAVQPGFAAQSAVSSGVWTLCEGRQATSRCQTVNGPAAKLKLEPRIVRPGVQAIALYPKPGLGGRRVIYSFGSDRPPPFRVRSARTWGGPWSLCPATRARCEIVDGVRTSLDVEVAAVRPGRAPERLQIATAAPPPAAPARKAGASAQAALAHDMPTPPPVGSTPIPLPPLSRAFPLNAEPFASAPPPPAPQAFAQASPAPRPRTAGPTQVHYACEDGRSLIVVFDPQDQTAEVLSQDEDPVVLDRADAPRGFRYENRNRAFYGDRAQAIYEDRDGEPVGCRAVQPRRSAYGEP